jgi:hypothetical protein
VQLEVEPEEGANATWSNVFDEADAAVLLDLNVESETPPEPSA